MRTEQKMSGSAALAAIQILIGGAMPERDGEMLSDERIPTIYTNDQLREALVASADECAALRAQLADKDAEIRRILWALVAEGDTDLIERVTSRAIAARAASGEDAKHE